MTRRALAALLREADALCARADRGDAAGAARLAEIGTELAASGYREEADQVRQLAWWVGYAGLTAKVRAAREGER